MRGESGGIRASLNHWRAPFRYPDRRPPDVTPERYRQVRNLYEAALERPAAAREAFLRDACRQDTDLLQHVKRLLSAHDQTDGFLQIPAVVEAGRERVPGRDGRQG